MCGLNKWMSSIYLLDRYRALIIYVVCINNKWSGNEIHQSKFQILFWYIYIKFVQKELF